MPVSKTHLIYLFIALKRKIFSARSWPASAKNLIREEAAQAEEAGAASKLLLHGRQGKFQVLSS